MTRSRLAALSLARVAIVTIAGAAARRGGRHRGVPAHAHRARPGPPSPAPGSRSTWPSSAPGSSSSPPRRCWWWCPRRCGRPPGPRARSGWPSRRCPCAAPGWARRSGWPVRCPGSLGVRMAFEPGHGRTAVPVRSALVGTTVAVAAVVAAMVFGASFLGLVGTPHRYGQNWAQELDLQVGSVPGAMGEQRPGADHRPDPVRGRRLRAGQRRRPRHTSGTTVPAIGLDQLRGRGFLTLLAGRAPAGPGEIALGPRTLRTLGLHIGQRVKVGANRRTSSMRIVGLGGPRGVRRRRRQRHGPRDRRRGLRLGPVPARAPAAARGKPATTSSSCGTGRAPTCGPHRHT